MHRLLLFNLIENLADKVVVPLNLKFYQFYAGNMFKDLKQKL